jgi:hypothetical protein
MSVWEKYISCIITTVSAATRLWFSIFYPRLLTTVIMSIPWNASDVKAPGSETKVLVCVSDTKQTTIANKC